MESRYACSVVLSLLAAAGVAQEIGVMKFPEGEVQHVVRADATPWKPCPPSLASEGGEDFVSSLVQTNGFVFSLLISM